MGLKTKVGWFNGLSHPFQRKSITTTFFRKQKSNCVQSDTKVPLHQNLNYCWRAENCHPWKQTRQNFRRRWFREMQSGADVTWEWEVKKLSLRAPLLCDSSESAWLRSLRSLVLMFYLSHRSICLWNVIRRERRAPQTLECVNLTTLRLKNKIKILLTPWSSLLSY